MLSESGDTGQQDSRNSKEEDNKTPIQDRVQKRHKPGRGGAGGAGWKPSRVAPENRKLGRTWGPKTTALGCDPLQSHIPLLPEGAPHGHPPLPSPGVTHPVTCSDSSLPVPGLVHTSVHAREREGVGVRRHLSCPIMFTFAFFSNPSWKYNVLIRKVVSVRREKWSYTSGSCLFLFLNVLYFCIIHAPRGST